jgi:uncharacterized membrane protein YraQ (UPF0718 family)
MKKLELKGVKFLLLIGLIYLGLFVFDNPHAIISLTKFIDIFTLLLPIFAFIIILTALINYFLKPKQIMKHFGEDSGKTGIFYSLLGGILSHGPMYAWYGMLSDMRKHGLKDGLIVIFFYARAVKLPLLPMMLAIFGLAYTIIINIYIIIFAIIQGKIMDKFNTKDTI